ncbi:MAG TPA: hypothetical protein VF363_00410 [Candidatus Eisenbacteria bacterium]
MRFRLVPPYAAVLIAISVFAFPGDGGEDPWRTLVKRITTTSQADSTAVLVLFDEDVVDALRSRLPRAFTVVHFMHPDAPRHDAFVRAQLGRMYQEAAASMQNCSDVWVVGRVAGSAGRSRAARFADMAASMNRTRALRGSIRTSQGTVVFSRWVDRPGGVAQRVQTRQAIAHADSVLARGVPTPIPITRPFTPTELALDPDTLSFYVTRLADTSFYAIGGCPDAELVFWNAPERLGQMGPGVVPVLVKRIADPSPFVRERVQEALLYATQDDRILARTGGEYLKFYDQRSRRPRDIVETWWAKYGHYWTVADSSR